MSMNPRTLRPSSNFSPRSISGLALWLDASDSSTLFQNSDGTVPATASSDPVGYWGDKSGNGRHAVQATAGSRPTISANTQNSKKMLGFDGANGKLTIPFPVTAADPVAMIAVARRGPSAWGGGGGGGYGSFLNSTGQGGTGGPQLRVDTGNIEVQGGSNKSTVLGSNVGVGSCAIIEGMVSSLATSLYVQGALVDSDAGAGAIVTTGTRTSIGAWNDGTQGGGPLSGDIAELICYRASLTTSQRQLLERYLASKWGITLAPQVSNADAQNWIDRVYANGGTVSSATAASVNQLCDSLESASLRDRFYRLNLFCGSNLNAALVPLYRGPSLGGTQYGGTTDTNNAFVGIGTDYAETGATGGLLGNGTTKYLNTGFNVDQLPGAANCHLSSFITGTQDITSVRTLVGTIFNSVTDRYRLFLRTDSSTPPNYTLQIDLGKSEGASQINRTNTSGGLLVGSRTSTTNLSLYAGGVSAAAPNTNPTAETTGASPFFVFARNGPTEYYNGRMAAYSIGAGMTAAQVTAYNTAIQAFQTAMGRV